MITYIVLWIFGGLVLGFLCHLLDGRVDHGGMTSYYFLCVLFCPLILAYGLLWTIIKILSLPFRVVANYLNWLSMERKYRTIRSRRP